MNSTNVNGPLSGLGWNASAFNIVTLGALAGNPYNEPVLSGSFSTNADTDGRVAVFGNLTNTGAPIGTTILGSYSDRYSLIVNGNSSTSHSYQVDGQAFVGGSAGSSPPQPTVGTLQTGANNLDFDFAAARTALESYSVNTLQSSSLNPQNYLAAPVPDPNHGSGYVINVTGSGAAVIDLNQAYLNGNGLYINYDTTKITAIVFNVGGTSITTGSQSLTINGQQPSLDSGGIPILFNFPTTQTLTIDGRFTASILAPFADFSSNANVSGNIIVGQVDGTAESHDDYFSGTGLQGFSTSTPEPMSFLLLGGGLIAIGGIRKRKN